MKEKLSLLALAVALVAGAAVLAGMMTPDPVDAAGCRCIQQQQTGVHTGMGVGSCAAAQADLLSILLAAAGCDDFCSYSVVYTNACFNDEPQAPTWYKSSGYLVYQCEICIEGPPPM